MLTVCPRSQAFGYSSTNGLRQALCLQKGEIWTQQHVSIRERWVNLKTEIRDRCVYMPGTPHCQKTSGRLEGSPGAESPPGTVWDF